MERRFALHDWRRASPGCRCCAAPWPTCRDASPRSGRSAPARVLLELEDIRSSNRATAWSASAAASIACSGPAEPPDPLSGAAHRRRPTSSALHQGEKLAAKMDVQAGKGAVAVGFHRAFLEPQLGGDTGMAQPAQQVRADRQLLGVRSVARCNSASRHSSVALRPRRRPGAPSAVQQGRHPLLEGGDLRSLK